MHCVTPHLTSRQDRNISIWVSEHFSFWFTPVLWHSWSMSSIRLQHTHWCCSCVTICYFREPFCIPWTNSAHTTRKTPKQVCLSASPLNRHARFPYTCRHSSCSTVCPVGWHLLFSSELLTCWLAVFWGEREVTKKNPTVLSHFTCLSQQNHDKTSSLTLPLCSLQSPLSTLPCRALAWSAQGKGSLSSSWDTTPYF